MEDGWNQQLTLFCGHAVGVVVVVPALVVLACPQLTPLLPDPLQDKLVNFIRILID